ncbi:caspase, EACC1-associated type [Streptosporangium amethystogenes]|uniref:caspase, EACC1-associated type n=1 Tax=Streptosporangium amethystogenes TaxID=2002 RepID=UPI0014705CB6|nr:AAA family ATPase [Streptosporangium amethystogenes]
MLLVGSGTYAAGSRLSAVPAAAATVSDLGRCLVERAGLDPAHLTTLIDPADPGVFGAAVVAAAEQAVDVLFVYYVGHGLVSARNELHLATRATQDLTRGIPAYQALPYEQVRQVLDECKAALTVIVLDCCFSGRAQGAARAEVSEVFASVRHGMYLLTSTNRDEAAWAPPGRAHTAFSGALIELLGEGDPTAPRLLTLDDVHWCLSRTLLEQGFPEPRRQAAGHGDRLPFVQNPAYSNSRQTGQTEQVGQVGQTEQVGQVGQVGQFSPYRGLAAFGPQDARFFFGRAELTRRLLERISEQLEREGPLLVTGPSGSGKSSLLGAGLIAHLDRSSPGSWVSFTPGEDPVQVLAERFAPLNGLYSADVRQHLEADPLYLRELLTSAARTERIGRTARPVIVVDQFEELFTACPDERQRQIFIQALHAACAAPLAQAPAVVVVGMRADFLGRCAAYPELLAALERAVFVSPMTSAQLRRVIEEPARQADLVLQDGLVELLFEDLSAGMTTIEAGGVLPLLSHALLATWQHRQDQTLTLTGYRATGGISQALARTADATLAPLDLASRQIARQLLPRLVRLGETTDDTRRRLHLEDLLPPSTEPQRIIAQRVLDRFIQARLVTVDNNTVEITHEALIRAWPQLRAWIETDRAGLLIEQHLADAARTWDHDGRDPAGLYRGSRLTLAADWAADPRHRDRLGPLSQAFLAASIKADLTEQRATRRRNQLRTGATAVLAVLVIALAAVGIALQQQSVDLGHEQRTTAAQKLSLVAAALRDDDPGNALRLGAAAMRINPSAENRAALVATLVGNHYRATLKGHTKVVSAVAVTSDGRTAITGSRDGTAIVWDLADRAHPTKLATLTDHTDPVSAVAVTPDGRTAITGSDDGTAIVWDLADRAHPTKLATLTDQTRSVSAVAVTSDGRTAITGSDDGTAVVWDLTNRTKPDKIATLTGHTGPVHAAALTSDGRTAITGSVDNTAIVWDVTNRAQPVRVTTLKGHTGPVSAVGVTPNGRTAITGSVDLATTVWDMTNRAQPVRVTTLKGHTRSAIKVALTFDGRTAITDGDSTAIVWDLTNRAQPARVTTLKGHTGPVSAVGVTPDGRTAITGGVDSTAIVWDVTNHAHPAKLTTLKGHTSDVSAVALTFDGRTAITGSDDSTAIVWDLTNRAQPAKVTTLKGHTGPVSAVAVTPDGRTAITGDGGTAIVWDLTNRAQPARVTTMKDPTGLVYAVALTSDGRTAITGSFDGIAIVWDLTSVTEITARPLNAACAILDRELSSEEWSQYARGVDPLKICET